MRFSFKLSFAPLCGPVVMTPRPTTTSTTPATLLCADALIALVLLVGLTDVDELNSALGCRFAPDVCTMAQQDHPLANQDSLICGPGLISQFSAFSTGGRAAHWPGFLPDHGPVKVHTNLTSLSSFVASVELARESPLVRLLARSERRQAMCAWCLHTR